MVSLNEARAKDHPGGSWGDGEGSARENGIHMVDTVQAEVARRRRDRDFHAERVRERKLWRSILLLVFVLGGAAAVFALMHAFNR